MRRRAVPPARGRERDGRLGRGAGRREVVLGDVGAGDEVRAVELDRGQAGRLGQLDRLARGRVGRAGGHPRRGAGRRGRRAPAAGRRGRGRRAGARGRCPPPGRWRARPRGRRRGGPGAGRPPCATRSSGGLSSSSGVAASAARASSAAATSPSSTASRARCTSTAGRRSADGGRRAIDRRTVGPAPASSRPRPWASRMLSTSSRVAGRRRPARGPRPGWRCSRNHRAAMPCSAAVSPGPRRCRAVDEVGAQQRVVAEPGAAAVEPADEGVALGEVLEHGGRVVATGEPGTASSTGELLDDGGAQQEVDDVLGQAHEHLAGEVVGDRPVGAAELRDELGGSSPRSRESAARRIPAGHPSVRCEQRRCASRRRARCRGGPRSRSASSAVKASWAARTSCSRPVSRSRCRPIGGSNRHPSATRTRPSTHSMRCWMPSSTSRSRTSWTSSRTSTRPGTSSPSTPSRVGDEGRVRRSGRRVEAAEHGGGVGRPRRRRRR